MFGATDLPDQETLKMYKKFNSDVDIPSVTICLQILNSHSEILTFAEGLLKNHDLTFSQFSLLIMLDDNFVEGYTPSELSSKTNISKASLTSILDSLEKNKWVIRRPHQHDRRKINIHLTKNGKRKIHQLMPDCTSFISELFSFMNTDEKKQLIDLLNLLKKQIHSMKERL